MNADRLFALYDRVAEAPDGVGRLRRFVLDLAVRGKLVKQDPADEPASELLKRMAKEQAERVKRKKRLPDVETVELGDIPINWCAVPLIALGQWAVGKGFPKNEQGRSEGPYFFLKVSDMNLPGNEKYITTANNYIDGDAAKRMKAAIHPAGTIIFPKIGGAIATNKRRILTRGSAIDNNCLGVTFSSHIKIEWAYWLMIHLDFTRYQAGTAVPALQQGTLAAIPVGLPPLAEQHRIVAKVDELMVLCDQLKEARTVREDTRDRLTKASLTRLVEPDIDVATFRSHSCFAVDALRALTARADQVKHLRQTILNLAVRGKLVEQDPADEPAAELLERIASARKLVPAPGRNTQNVTVHSPLAEMASSLPPGWASAQLSQLVRVLNGRAYKKAELLDSGTPVLRVGNLFTSKHWYYSNLQLKEDKYCNEGDLLYAWSASFGPVIWQGPRVIFHYHIWKLSLFTEANLNKRFLYYFLLQHTQEIKSEGHGISMVHMTKGKMETLAVPIPPLAEQHRIVAKVDDLMAHCDRLEAGLDALGSSRNRLLESLLHDALVSDEVSTTGRFHEAARMGP